MSFFTNFLIISILFGPGMAISYGLENPLFMPTAHLSTLLVIESLSVILVYTILRLLPTETRFKNKLLDKIALHIHGSRKSAISVMENVSDKFKKNFGDLGFYMALALISFAYGVYIAAAVAYFLKIKLKQAVISIAIGGAFAIVFWWYLALGAIPFVTPTLIFVVITGLSIAFMIYGFFRENRVIRRIGDELVERRNKLVERRNRLKKEIKGNVKKVGKRLKRSK